MNTSTLSMPVSRAVRRLGAVVVGVIVLFSPAASYANGPTHVIGSNRSDRSDQGENQAFSIMGRIESVDYAANVIVVRSHGESYSIAITPTTSVERAGQVGSIADLRPHTRVRVKGVVQGGQMTAVTIVIR